MRKSNYLGWQVLTMAIFSLANICHGLPPASIGTKSDYSAISSTQATDTPIPEDQDLILSYPEDAFNVFDWNLYKQMSTNYEGNLLISPISLKLALILLYEGSLGRTAAELATAMNLPDARSAVRDKFSSIIRSLQPAFDEFKLNLGTRIFLDSQITTTQRYDSIIKAFYRTDVVSTDFTKPITAAKIINDWASNVTQTNIQNIIDDGDSIKDSVMLILNVLYFKGSWYKNQFSINDTRPRTFYKTVDSSIEVPFMYSLGDFYYTESAELDASFLRIPYVGRKFAMYIVLPQKRDGLDELVRKINSHTLARTIRTMQELPVDVYIPKFKFDFTSHLESILRELGIRDIFDTTATFNEIAHAKRDSPQVVVSDVVQKTGIEVNEQGTTAYAISEIQLVNKMENQAFIADQPFLFFIKDEITETILYMGRVSDPSGQSGSTKNAVPIALNTRNARPIPSG